MDTTQKLLHYFRKLSDKKQLEIVDFVQYLYDRQHQASHSHKQKSSFEKTMERIPN